MKVLIIGGGGREHAILRNIDACHEVSEIYCAPGNAGTEKMAINVPISPLDTKSLLAFALEKAIDLTVVGMDDTLMLGVVDLFEQHGLKIFGPNKKAAIIEGSKAYSKDFMKKYNIPTAEYAIFDDYEKASAYLDQCSYPLVIKADGLALGKGVLICNTKDEAKEGLVTCMIDEKFGKAGRRVVLEEFLIGREVSVLSFCDGHTILPMVSAQDHKRSHDGDEGLNTGGMGTFSPSPFYDDDLADQCYETIYKPTVEGLKKEGRPFKGIIFFGLMLTEKGPKLLEYNARFGDPEAQVVLPRLKTPLTHVFHACIDEKLHEIELKWTDDAAVCVICASGGYPVSYEKGYPISGLDRFEDLDKVMVYHAGTRKDGDHIVTNGGRVLGVTALGDDLVGAKQMAYESLKKISFKDMHFRSDIGSYIG